MHIRSGGGYPSSALSDFAPHRFVLDGVECASMEGLLQSLECTDKEASGIDFCSDSSTSDRRLS
jgi:hypothetical protein